MNIFVQSAGAVVDYDWQSLPLGSPPMPMHLKNTWHVLICEQDKVFALVAGYTENSWHIEFRNLLLPGVTDHIAGRQIIFNIWFSGLKNEKEVRALALAYLDFELKTKNNSGRPIARFQEELAKAYKPTEDGNFEFDTEIAEAWAQRAISEYSADMESNAAKECINCTVNPADNSELEKLRHRLKTVALTEKEGVSLLWSDMTISSAKIGIPDIKLKYRKSGSAVWETAPPASAPTAQPMQPGDNFKKALKFAQEKLQPIVTKVEEKIGSKPKKSNHKTIWGIILVAAGVVTLFFMLSEKKNLTASSTPVVNTPPPPVQPPEITESVQEAVADSRTQETPAPENRKDVKPELGESETNTPSNVGANLDNEEAKAEMSDLHDKEDSVIAP